MQAIKCLTVFKQVFICMVIINRCILAFSENSKAPGKCRAPFLCPNDILSTSESLPTAAPRQSYPQADPPALLSLGIKLHPSSFRRVSPSSSGVHFICVKFSYYSSVASILKTVGFPGSGQATLVTPASLSHGCLPPSSITLSCGQRL